MVGCEAQEKLSLPPHTYHEERVLYMGVGWDLCPTGIHFSPSLFRLGRSAGQEKLFPTLAPTTLKEWEEGGGVCMPGLHSSIAVGADQDD